MKINTQKCVCCMRCINFCPVNSISAKGETVTIDQEECVECGVCLNTGICPVDAIYMPEDAFEYPRAIRMQFSDPGAEHPNFKAWGRGTEEAKTNDVTGKFGHGEFGVLMEFGRPGTGTRLKEVEKITTAIAERNIPILEDNPLYGLLEKDGTGRIRPEFVDEKILSAILEIRLTEEQLTEFLSFVLPLLDTLDTVVSVGLVTRFEGNGSLPVIKKLESMGIQVRPNAKINVGLGRPLAKTNERSAS